MDYGYIETQLIEGYNADLNRLFVEWISSYDPKEHDKFCQDGLVVKYKDKNSGYDINKEWHNAERKIMFIVKDCPDKYGYDTRRLLVGCENDEQSQKNAKKTRDLTGKTCFFKNIARMLYGLQYMTEKNKGKELNEQANNDECLKKVFNDIPFAYIEAKKLAGDSKCSPKALREALDHDGSFLSREINILRPNIIVCCDPNGDIFNSVVKNCFQGRIPTEDAKWNYMYEKCNFRCQLYFYKKEGVLLFRSYHPTRLGKEEWKIYEKVLSPFRQFFEKYKTFSVVSSTAD